MPMAGFEVQFDKVETQYSPLHPAVNGKGFLMALTTTVRVNLPIMTRILYLNCIEVYKY